jgi:D-mannonate dehydratase
MAKDNQISTRQKYINILGGIIVAISVAAIVGGWRMLMQLRTTIDKADLALEKIESNNRVYHLRITENENKIEKYIEDYAEWKGRLDERTKAIQRELLLR